MSNVLFGKIAAEVGVSPRTVQRILNSPLKDTRPAIVRRAQNIRDLAEKLNYRPNVAAKATASGKFGCISLLRANESEVSGHSVLLSDSILEELHNHQMHLVLHRLPSETLSAAGFLPQMVVEAMCDGLLINYTHRIPAPMIAAIARHAIPSVWMNVKRPANSVYPDDVAAGRMATEHLIQRGHRKIGYFRMGGSGHYSETDRLDGYFDAMTAAGLKPDVTEVACTRPVAVEGRIADLRFKPALAWMDRPDRPDAVVTYSGWTALPLVTAAFARGVRPGEDLAITTIEDAPVTAGGVPITTVVLDIEQLGRQSVKMLVKIIANGGELESSKIPCHLVFGET